MNINWFYIILEILFVEDAFNNEALTLQWMKKESISKKTILKTVAKMLTDKELVRSYIKGKTPIQTLTKKGIKFAKPL